MSTKKIIICGDVHADWASINTLINDKAPDIILQVGDLGYFPRFHGKKEIRRDAYGKLAQDMDGNFIYTKPFDAFGIKAQNTIVRFAPGNHCDWNELTYIDEVSKKYEIMPNVFFMPIASTYKLPDGRQILFFGKADSIDNGSRTPYVDWFPSELPTQREIRRLEDINHKIDILISHTCSEEELAQMMNKRQIDKSNYHDPTRQVLSYVLEKFRPSLHFFGHFHNSAKGVWKDTHWQAMNMSFNKDGWWTYLPN